MKKASICRFVHSACRTGTFARSVGSSRTQAQSLSKLIQIVRNSNSQYQDVGAATAAGYGPFLGCVSGSDHGAMGIHYVNPSLLQWEPSIPRTPRALIYE